MSERTILQHFEVGNDRIYAGALVYAFVGDPITGLATATLARLWADPVTATQLENPQRLTSAGRWKQPVWHDVPVVLQIQALGAQLPHSTGLINPQLSAADAALALQAAREAADTLQQARRDRVRARDAASDAAASASQAQGSANQIAANLQNLVRSLRSIFVARTRQILTGAGLTGGGALVQDRTLALDPLYTPNFLNGFRATNDPGDLTNDVAFTAGVCTDSANARFIRLAAGVTRQLDVAFETGNGGLSSSLVAGLADGTYHAFAVVTAAGAANVAYDTSVVAANLITDHGILAWRRIFSLVRAGGAIRAFLQNVNNPDEVIWTADGVASVSATNPGTGAQTGTAAVPLGIVVDALLTITLDIVGSGGSNVSITSLDQTDVVASVNNNVVSIAVAGGADSQAAARGKVKTNTNGQFRYRMGVSAAGDQVRMGTLGYVDSRGRFG